MGEKSNLTFQERLALSHIEHVHIEIRAAIPVCAHDVKTGTCNHSEYVTTVLTNIADKLAYALRSAEKVLSERYEEAYPPLLVAEQRIGFAEGVKEAADALLGALNGLQNVNIVVSCDPPGKVSECD